MLVSIPNVDSFAKSLTLLTLSNALSRSTKTWSPPHIGMRGSCMALECGVDLWDWTNNRAARQCQATLASGSCVERWAKKAQMGHFRNSMSACLEAIWISRPMTALPRGHIIANGLRLAGLTGGLLGLGINWSQPERHENGIHGVS